MTLLARLTSQPVARALCDACTAGGCSGACSPAAFADARDSADAHLTIEGRLPWSRADHPNPNSRSTSR